MFCMSRHSIEEINLVGRDGGHNNNRLVVLSIALICLVRFYNKMSLWYGGGGRMNYVIREEFQIRKMRHKKNIFYRRGRGGGALGREA